MAELNKNKNKKIIKCINYYGDRAACGWYRMSFPAMTLETLLIGDYSFKFLESQYPVLDKDFYLNDKNLRVIRIQRWTNPQQLNILKSFLRPIANLLGIWIVYEIDDVLSYDEIPKYNMAKEAFNPETIGNSIYEILDLCDIISVTTNELKNLYITKYNVNPQKIIVIPNFLPRWWIGETYNLDSQLKQWDIQHKHPHIGFACSSNHFDIKNLNNGIDDFSELIPWIKKNLNRYKFKFVGGCPRQLFHEAQENKVELQSPSDILNYPRELKNRGIDLFVAPLINNTFNKCKSNIKWLEFSAVGIPMIGQNISTYNQYTDQVFSNSDDIDEWIDMLFFRKDSRDFYANLIIKNRNIVEGNKNSKSWWLEKNIKYYYDLYSLPQGTVTFSF